MRFKSAHNVLDLCGVIITFFKRKVMGFGVLRYRIFRILFVLLLLFTIGGMTVLMYQFWESTESTVEQTSIVLDVYALTGMMWTFCCFLFVKILFLKTPSFLSFTCQFPVTKREIRAALLVFELLTALVVIFAVSAPIVLSLLYRYGPTFFHRILYNILFMSTTFYLVLDAIYVLMEYILQRFRITKLRGVVMLCIHTVLLIICYVWGFNQVTESLLWGYVENAGTSPVLMFAFLSEKFGVFAAIVAYLVGVGLLTAVIISVPVETEDHTNQYLKLGKKSADHMGMLPSYIRCVSRDIDSYNYIILAYFIFALVTMMGNKNSLYSIMILSLNGIYLYFHTEGVRFLQLQKRYSVIQDYGSLLAAQVFHAVVVSLPMMMIHLLVFRDFMGCFMVYMAMCFAHVVMICVGILFPAKKDNPFSAMLGIGSLMLFSFVILFVLFFIKLSTLGIVVVFLTIAVLCVMLSLQGMCHLVRRERGERW